MRTSFCVLCIMIAGCAARYTPDPSSATRRYKVDIGFLDDPRVQERVAARETYRRKTTEVVRTFFKVVERFQAMNFAALKIGQSLDEEHVAQCREEGLLLQSSLVRLPETLKYASERADVLNERVERARYGADDVGMEHEIDDVKRAIDLADKDTASTEAYMRGFCRCLGLSFTIRNPRGDVVFQTSSSTQI